MLIDTADARLSSTACLANVKHTEGSLAVCVAQKLSVHEYYT